MKLSMEIKDDKFHYDYEIGPHSKGHGDMPICADALCWFTEALKQCHRLFLSDNAKKMSEIEVLAYIETHPEVIKKVRK